jgi:large subunit ribosomal protein L13
VAKSKTNATDPLIKEPLVVDASDYVAGRLASVVAKQLLLGEYVIIINAEKAVLSGNRHSLITEYKERLGIRTRSAPWKGPLHPRQPHGILHRIVRGMVPWKKARGKEAMKRLRVYTGAPEDLKIKRRLELPEFERKGRRTVYLGEIARELGWSGIV